MLLQDDNVISIFKKETKLKCSSYSPILLLSDTDKILERIIYNHLYTFLESVKNFQQKH